MDTTSSIEVSLKLQNEQLLIYIILPRILKYMDCKSRKDLRLVGQIWNEEVMKFMATAQLRNQMTKEIWSYQHCEKLNNLLSTLEHVSTPWMIDYLFSNVGMNLRVILDHNVSTFRVILEKYGYVVKSFKLNAIVPLVKHKGQGVNLIPEVEAIKVTETTQVGENENDNADNPDGDDPDDDDNPDGDDPDDDDNPDGDDPDDDDNPDGDDPDDDDNPEDDDNSFLLIMEYLSRPTPPDLYNASQPAIIDFLYRLLFKYCKNMDTFQIDVPKQYHYPNQPEFIFWKPDRDGGANIESFNNKVATNIKKLLINIKSKEAIENSTLLNIVFAAKSLTILDINGPCKQFIVPMLTLNNHLWSNINSISIDWHVLTSIEPSLISLKFPRLETIKTEMDSYTLRNCLHSSKTSSGTTRQRRFHGVGCIELTFALSNSHLTNQIFNEITHICGHKFPSISSLVLKTEFSWGSLWETEFPQEVEKVWDVSFKSTNLNSLVIIGWDGCLVDDQEELLNTVKSNFPNLTKFMLLKNRTNVHFQENQGYMNDNQLKSALATLASCSSLKELKIETSWVSDMMLSESLKMIPRFQNLRKLEITSGPKFPSMGDRGDLANGIWMNSFVHGEVTEATVEDGKDYLFMAMESAASNPQVQIKLIYFEFADDNGIKNFIRTHRIHNVSLVPVPQRLSGITFY